MLAFLRDVSQQCPPLYLRVSPVGASTTLLHLWLLLCVQVPREGRKHSMSCAVGLQPAPFPILVSSLCQGSQTQRVSGCAPCPGVGHQPLNMCVILGAELWSRGTKP